MCKIRWVITLGPENLEPPRPLHASCWWGEEMFLETILLCRGESIKKKTLNVTCYFVRFTGVSGRTEIHLPIWLALHRVYLLRVNVTCAKWNLVAYWMNARQDAEIDWSAFRCVYSLIRVGLLKRWQIVKWTEFEQSFCMNPKHFTNTCRLLLLGLGSNILVKDVEVDISGNDLRSSGAQVIENCIPNISNITTFNIADNSKFCLLPCYMFIVVCKV